MNEQDSSYASAPAAPIPARGRTRLQAAAILVLGLVAAGGLAVGWSTQQRLRLLEQELVKRQQDSQGEAVQAMLLAKQSQDAVRESAARLALLDARVSEAALQRTQIEELIQSLSRSRDENMVADVEASIRVALQHSAITGSTEPLAQALQHADERLARYNQPRLERVRRALALDLDRVRAVAVGDIATLTLRLDEVVRLVDELPLQASVEARRVEPPASAPRAAASGLAPTHSASQPEGWGGSAAALWREWIGRVGAEVRALVRVSRVEHPEALLLAPEQMYFLRENLKLRLLNARLALLSRQFATAQSDLRDAQAALEQYFDPASRRVQSATELLRQVASQARQVSLPRPEQTLAALAAAAAGR